MRDFWISEEAVNRSRGWGLEARNRAIKPSRRGCRSWTQKRFLHEKFELMFGSSADIVDELANGADGTKYRSTVHSVDRVNDLRAERDNRVRWRRSVRPSERCSSRWLLPEAWRDQMLKPSWICYKRFPTKRFQANNRMDGRMLLVYDLPLW